MTKPGTPYALFESVEAIPVEAPAAAQGAVRRFSELADTPGLKALARFHQLRLDASSLPREAAVDQFLALATNAVQDRVETESGLPLGVAAFAEARESVERALDARTGPPSSGNRHVIPVAYGGDDGPDLADVARRCGLAESDVVARHTADELRRRVGGELVTRRPAALHRQEVGRDGDVPVGRELVGDTAHPA